MRTPLLQTHLDRLQGCTDTTSIASTLADSVFKACGAAAVGVFLRDCTGDTLFMAGHAPINNIFDREVPQLKTDNLDDPLCYCLHTSAPVHLLLSFGCPESVKAIPVDDNVFVTSFKIYPLVEPGGRVAGGLIALFSNGTKDYQPLCQYLCQYSGALLRLTRENNQHSSTVQSMAEQLKRMHKTDKSAFAALEALQAFVGDSPAAHALREMANKAAGANLPVFITGETGTGKSMVARLIHNASARSSRPFMEINCGALPANLLESELFGHVKGAFSGASAHNKGLLRSAQGGTVLLDEIGEMPPHLQVVLLQVLQEHAVRPVGGTTFSPVDIRIIAATNCDVAQAIQAGTFRLDLYHRLAVLKVHIPPLRERREDIPALSTLFLERCAHKSGRKSLGFTPDASFILLGHAYPGNARELQAIVERAVSLAPPDCTELGPEFMATEDGLPPSSLSLASFRTMQENWFIQKVFSLYKGDVHTCAKALGVHPRTIYRRLSSQGLCTEQECPCNDG